QDSRERLVLGVTGLNESGSDQGLEGKVGGGLKLGQAGPPELVPIPFSPILPDRFQEKPLAWCEGRNERVAMKMIQGQQSSRSLPRGTHRGRVAPFSIITTKSAWVQSPALVWR